MISGPQEKDVTIYDGISEHKITRSKLLFFIEGLKTALPLSG